jgi:hypothetical protein
MMKKLCIEQFYYQILNIDKSSTSTEIIHLFSFLIPKHFNALLWIKDDPVHNTTGHCTPSSAHPNNHQFF